MEEDILPSGKNNFHGCVYCIAFGQPTSGDMFAEKGLKCHRDEQRHANVSY
jgi:hypothetical protein